MKVSTFIEKDIKNVKNRVLRLQKEIDPDLFIFFAPYTFFESEDLLSMITADKYCNCIGISTVAVVQDNKIEYGAFGGIFIKFERSGRCLVRLIDNISKDLEKSADFLEENLIPEKKGTNLLFSTSSNLQVNKVLNRIFKGNKKEIRLYGGIASSDAPDFRTYISVNGKLLKDGFVILNLENIESFNTISLGFIPVGTTYTITRAVDNRVYSLDDMPVVYFLNNILKNTGITPYDLDPVKTSEVLWEFPFLFIEDSGYVSHLLVPMCFDVEDEALLFYGEVLEGSKIKLSTGDSEDILMDVKIRSEEFSNILKDRDFKSDLILNITCTARNYILIGDGLESKEQEIYYEKFNGIPFAGFLTFGEIGPDRMGKAGKFYNETSILLGLYER
ncbi:FIST signal transduction protein [Persephonella sp.]